MSDLDFPAKQAREFTDNYERINVEKWYDEVKFQLFDNIKEVALKGGGDSISVTPDFWGGNEAKKKYLMSNLKSKPLCYNVSINKDEVMLISW